GRRAGRQRRGFGAGSGSHHRRRARLGWTERAEPDAGPGEPAVRQQRHQPVGADDERRRGPARLRRRDRGGLLRRPCRRGSPSTDPRPARLRAGACSGGGLVEGVALLTVLILAAFTGYEVIAKVSSTLHTPLMSGTNAISGIILVGSVIVAGRAESTVTLAVALVGVALATVYR